MPGFVVGGIGGGVAAANIKPVYQYTWEIVNLFEDNNNIFSDSSTKLLAKEATLPTFTATKDTVDGSSLVYKYAGMITWEDVRITFYDTVIGSNMASDIIKNWREKVWSVATGIRSPTEYKKDSIIKVYNLDFTYATTWTLHGSWPQIVKEGELTYTATEIKVIDVTIAYDWAVSVSGDTGEGATVPATSYAT